MRQVCYLHRLYREARSTGHKKRFTYFGLYIEVMYTMLDLHIFGFEVKNPKKELGDFKYKKYRMYVILTLRRLMSYIYIYGAPILDVSRSHTTTQHSR